MDLGGAESVEAALDTFRTGLHHLVKLVEDGSLEALDDTRFVGFLQEFERARNQLSLVDHRGVKDAQRRTWRTSCVTRICRGRWRRPCGSPRPKRPAGSGRRKH